MYTLSGSRTVMVMSDMTLYAVWSAVEPTPQPPVQPTPSNDTSSGGANTDVLLAVAGVLVVILIIGVAAAVLTGGHGKR